MRPGSRGRAAPAHYVVQQPPVPVVAGAPLGMPVAAAPIVQPVQPAPATHANVAVAVTGYTDTPGHTEYLLTTEADVAGTRMCYTMQQRFSAFVDFHEKLRHRQPAIMARMPAEFPVPKALFNGSAELKQQRVAQLQSYLQMLIGACVGAGRPLPPIVLLFLGMNM